MIQTLHIKIEENMKHSLHKSALDQMEQFEAIYNEWNVIELISWIKFIENGRFNDKIYSKCIKKIEELEIDGGKMKELNDSLLKSFGFDEIDRKILIKNIKRVLSQKSASRTKNNLCMICIENKVNTVFTPCGHQAVCYGCYENSPYEYMKCSICREDVDKRTCMK